MLIDNKTTNKSLNITTVWDFIDNFSGNDSKQIGRLDIVTGYFMIQTLAKLNDSIPAEDEFRIISSEMVGDDFKNDYIVNLLSDNLDINNLGMIDSDAKKAVAFLKRKTVQMRAEIPDFCHAKAYLFTNNDPKENSFYVSGSSNFTPAGIGLKSVPNVELNIAKRIGAEEVEFKELKDWYERIWSNARTEVPEDRDNAKSKKIPVKEYFIRKIENYFRAYTPEEIYYKILYELFNSDMDLDGGIEHTKDMTLLQTSVIWNTLFNYQQKGVISLIKMLRKYNGAILADAVGLGKTFSALAVIKYFETQNYSTILLCPKKLEQNWKQYIKGAGSRFDKDDLNYEVRFHTDLQDGRLQNYPTYNLDYIQNLKKVLIVIDESHNLRNESSSRYKELLQSLIQNQPGVEVRDVKVLLLSATPINTGLKDVKGQFNLIGHGRDDAFDSPEFGVESLKRTFEDAQKKYNLWCDDPHRTIGSFIKVLPPKFFNLTDRLIVARTRKLIEKTLGEDLGFPTKTSPENIYQGVDHFGTYKTTEDIYKAFEALSLTAYQPSRYLPASVSSATVSAHWDDDVYREMFLVKMMCILFMKRLESSWYALMLTVKKVLDVHQETLDKVVAYNELGADAVIRNGAVVDEDNEDGEEDLEHDVVRRQIMVSDIKNLSGFEKGLRYDLDLLRKIYDSLLDFESNYREKKEQDLKLDELVKILNAKKQSNNHKVVIFTAYADTAEFIFNELKARGFSGIAAVTGQKVFSAGSHTKVTDLLQSFAPYSKLYKELDWDSLYSNNLDHAKYYDQDKHRWNVPYDLWKELILKHKPEYAKLLNDGIDILVATDCLSEGQNLQDADMQINYDIHWNPVRLIQRFGRIDRIGSPNKSISCVNFWPAKSFEDYLKLESRIQNRMSIMNLVGSETQELNETYRKMVADNPLQDKNADRLLNELTKNSISEIESPDTLSMTDFSLESYRQDLVDNFAKNRDFYRCMPNGVFSGFCNMFPEEYNIPDSLVALLGYPKKPEGKQNHVYTEYYLLCQPVDASPEWHELNIANVLEFLRKHKKAERYVPSWITDHDAEHIARLSGVLASWMSAKAPRQAIANIKESMHRRVINIPESDKNHPLIEEKFQVQNFDLIVWDYVTNDKEIKTYKLRANYNPNDKTIIEDLSQQQSCKASSESDSRDFGSDDVARIHYTPPYQSFCMPPALKIEYNRRTKEFKYEFFSHFEDDYHMSNQMISDFMTFLDNTSKLSYVINREQNAGTKIMGAHYVNDYLEISWMGQERLITLTDDSEIGNLCRTAVHQAYYKQNYL